MCNKCWNFYLACGLVGHLICQVPWIWVQIVWDVAIQHLYLAKCMWVKCLVMFNPLMTYVDVNKNLDVSWSMRSQGFLRKTLRVKLLNYESTDAVSWGINCNYSTVNTKAWKPWKTWNGGSANTILSACCEVKFPYCENFHAYDHRQWNQGALGALSPATLSEFSHPCIW